MKEKGFTLAELLGVIAILGVLALIVVPVVDKNVKEGKEELYQKQIESIRSSAQMWGTDHLDELPGKNETKTITLSILQQDGYISSDIKNPKTDTVFSGSLKIQIKNNGTSYTYKVLEE